MCEVAAQPRIGAEEVLRALVFRLSFGLLAAGCPGEQPIEDSNGAQFWMWTGKEDQVRSTPELLEGTFSAELITNVDSTYTWHFTRQKEAAPSQGGAAPPEASPAPGS